MEDVNEANLIHLVSKLSDGSDTELSATLVAIRELIGTINSKVLSINKKYKKNLSTIDDVPKREICKRINKP